MESSWRLVYHQVLGGLGITHCSRQSDIYFPRGSVDLYIHWSSPCNFIFHVFNFRGWSWPWNYFNSKNFPNLRYMPQLLYSVTICSMQLVIWHYIHTQPPIAMCQMRANWTRMGQWPYLSLRFWVWETRIIMVPVPCGMYPCDCRSTPAAMSVIYTGTHNLAVVYLVVLMIISTISL